MISYGSFRKRSLTKHSELLVINLSNQRNFSLLLGAGGLSLGLEDCLHLLALSLSSDVGAETLLGELQASLVFRHLQQLQTTLLVRSKSRNRKKETALHVAIMKRLSHYPINPYLYFSDYLYKTISRAISAFISS